MVEEIKTDRNPKPSVGRSKELVGQIYENPPRAPVQIPIESWADYTFVTGKSRWDAYE